MTETEAICKVPCKTKAGLLEALGKGDFVKTTDNNGRDWYWRPSMAEIHSRTSTEEKTLVRNWKVDNKEAYDKIQAEMAEFSIKNWGLDLKKQILDKRSSVDMKTPTSEATFNDYRSKQISCA